MQSTRPLAVACLALSLSASAADAQTADRAVYQVRADGCRDDRGATANPRSLSGFLLREVGGLVTALHGVAGCDTLIALRDEPTANGPTIRRVDVAISRVHFAADLAVLVPVSGTWSLSDALDRATAAPNGNQRVLVRGHPHGIRQQIESHLVVRQQASVPLEFLLPERWLVPLQNRRSPLPTDRVISLEGHLTLGYSGAPILADPGARVVGVANGGLANGSVEISWATPLPAPSEWRPYAEVVAAVRQLRSLPDVLLDYSEPAAAQAAGFRCFDHDFQFVRSAGVADLVRADDDPLLTQGLVRFYGLQNDPAEFEVFRDPASLVTLVRPAGWAMRARGAECVATDGASGQEVVFELFDHDPGASVPVDWINQRVIEREYSNLCQRGYIYDAQSGTARQMMVRRDRSIIANTRHYLRMAQECRMPSPPPMSFAPGVVPPMPWQNNPGWASTNRAQPTPRGMMQCQFQVCPTTQPIVPVSPYGYPAPYGVPQLPQPVQPVPIPQFWFMNFPNVIVPWSELVDAISVARYVGTHHRLLVATVRHEQPGFVHGLGMCYQQFASSQACRARYDRQRTFTLAALAAHTSTVSSNPD